jgi:hypothetical protein
MTAKTTKGAKPTAKKAKRLGLGKKTLKDLTARGKGPPGGKAARTTISTRILCTVFGCL